MDPLTTTPTVEQTPPPKGGMGALIGAIIIIALLIFGGLYFYGMKLKNDSMQEASTVEFNPAPVQEQAMSDSDEAAAISADTEADAAYMAQLEANLDADLKAIESY